MTKNYSPACDRNKEYILEVIKPLLKENDRVLEIGSGTGQHSVYFGEHIPYIVWQTSDLLENHESISEWIEESNLTNVLKPIIIDASKDDWHNQNFNFVFTANTFHIMSFEFVKKLFEGLNKVLNQDSYFAVYGPFNFNGNYTSDSNREFDLFIRDKYPSGGIRNFEDIKEVAKANRFDFHKKFDMPSNNQILVFKNY